MSESLLAERAKEIAESITDRWGNLLVNRDEIVTKIEKALIDFAEETVKKEWDEINKWKPYLHHCYTAWDGLLINVGDKEFEYCDCFPRKPSAAKADTSEEHGFEEWWIWELRTPDGQQKRDEAREVWNAALSHASKARVPGAKEITDSHIELCALGWSVETFGLPPGCTTDEALAARKGFLAGAKYAMEHM